MDISIVVPAYNEDTCIKQLHEEITETMKKLGRQYELIIVDDGSSDNTFNVLKDLSKTDKNLVTIKLRKNFGQTPAMLAGFHAAKGKIIVTLDSDLQNDPKDIPRLLDKLEKGFDVVCGWRMDRKDNIFKKIPSRLSNYLNRKLTGTGIHDSGCTLRAYKRDAVKGIKLYGENHRYIPAIIAGEGFKVTEIVTHHRPRRFGKSKYGPGRLIKGLLDILTLKFLLKYGSRPIHVLGSMGILVIFLGFLSGSYMLVEKFYYGKAIANRPMLILTLLLGVTGIQFFFTGVIAEMLIRTRQDVNATYTVEQVYKKGK